MTLTKGLLVEDTMAKNFQTSLLFHCSGLEPHTYEFSLHHLYLLEDIQFNDSLMIF